METNIGALVPGRPLKTLENVSSQWRSMRSASVQASPQPARPRRREGGPRLFDSRRSNSSSNAPLTTQTQTELLERLLVCPDRFPERVAPLGRTPRSYAEGAVATTHTRATMKRTHARRAHDAQAARRVAANISNGPRRSCKGKRGTTGSAAVDGRRPDCNANFFGAL